MLLIFLSFWEKRLWEVGLGLAMAGFMVVDHGCMPSVRLAIQPLVRCPYERSIPSV